MVIIIQQLIHNLYIAMSMVMREIFLHFRLQSSAEPFHYRYFRTDKSYEKPNPFFVLKVFGTANFGTRAPHRSEVVSTFFS